MKEEAAITWVKIAEMIGLSLRHTYRLRETFEKAGVIFFYRLNRTPGRRVYAMFPSEYKRWCALMARNGSPVPRAYKPRKKKSDR